MNVNLDGSRSIKHIPPLSPHVHNKLIWLTSVVNICSFIIMIHGDDHLSNNWRGNNTPIPSPDIFTRKKRCWRIIEYEVILRCSCLIKQRPLKCILFCIPQRACQLLPCLTGDDDELPRSPFRINTYPLLVYDMCILNNKDAPFHAFFVLCCAMQFTAHGYEWQKNGSCYTRISTREIRAGGNAPEIEDDVTLTWPLIRGPISQPGRPHTLSMVTHFTLIRLYFTAPMEL